MFEYVALAEMSPTSGVGTLYKSAYLFTRIFLGLKELHVSIRSAQSA